MVNKIKTQLSVVTLALCLCVISSCNDFLEVESQNIITEEKFWNEKSDVENIIAGCYSAMQSNSVLSRMMIWGEFRSENIVANGNISNLDSDLERILKENITASNQYTYYGDFYSIINECNLVIARAPEVAAKDPSYTKSELNAHIAEVTALRSLCYFYLIRTFENVPYSEEVFTSDDQAFELPAESFSTILKKLIASLEEVKSMAVNKYPVSIEKDKLSDDYQTARITRMAIYAMLCEMYLWDKDYDNCIKYADLIIEQKKEDAKEIMEENMSSMDFSDFNGYPLIGTRHGFTNYFGAAFNNIFVQGNSMESIFELTFVKESGSSMPSNGPASNFYGNLGRNAFCKASDYVATDVTKETPVVFNNKYDGRAYENFRFSNNAAIGINKYACAYPSTVQLGDPNSNSFFTSGTWGTMYETEGVNNESRNKSNFIIYRLTDIMLLKAEALAQKITDDASISTPEDIDLRNRAFDLVTAINKRSLYQTALKDTLIVTNYASKDRIVELVLAERERELMFEGKRYFDLVRRAQRDGDTKYLRGKAKLKSSENASVIESKLTRIEAMYWPYNLDEMKANQYLIQNPAFGSGENESWE